MFVSAGITDTDTESCQVNTELSWFETVYDSENVSDFHLEISDKSVSTAVPKNNDDSQVSRM